MTKVRTVVPANAKPGKSIIQVTHPKTGKAVRSTVPKDAIPGQMIELEIPDPADTTQQTRADSSRLELPPSTIMDSQVGQSSDENPPNSGSSKQKSALPAAESKKPAVDVPQLPAEAPVENVVYYQQQPQPVYVQPSVVQQPVYVQPVTPQPYFVQQPVVYQQKPNVVVVHEQKKGIDEDDFCAGMCAACACTWLLLALSGK